MGFTIDPNLGKVADAYAADCVSFLAANLSVHLDYSAASVAAVEQCLEVFHAQKAAAPGEQHIQQFSKMFGSYLGETYRRLYGGEWGVDGDRQPAFRTPSGLVCYPWTRAYRRITNGYEDNVAHWFQYLVENGGAPAQQRTPVPPPLTDKGFAATTSPKPAGQKSFFSRVFGK